MSKRHKLFFFAAALLFAVVLGRMFILAGSAGQELRKNAENISCKSGKLAAIRGRIFDENDSLLAWSERCYDLAVKSPAAPGREKILAGKLKSKLNISLDLASLKPETLPVVIKYNLTADELAAADELAENHAEFDIILRWERRSAKYSDRLGEVKQANGMEYGISGWEKEFDSRLQGEAGTFTVMLDRHGKWINSTFRIRQAARRGEDIYLSEELGDEE